ncbi:amidase [Dichotomopilus funicola]|uniref:Amidase n=1 Tax=Dichotomopilus funicola TaxID=1934379 RepID=A0AAN6UZA2_9PEZI|nr:amidase [Dichotomopilus funicola]
MINKEPRTPGQLPPLMHLTIEYASRGLESGRFTSVALTKAYLARITEASEFRAVLQVNPNALDVAPAIGQGADPPLHGIPLLVKDNVVTQEELDASAGSYALLGAKPGVESSVIAKLREAGVLLLGKTNLSERANLRGLNVSSGWSPRGDQTLGAYYPGSQPDGSSASSAVAAALTLCTAAIGTETVGSILAPAERNNVVGFKPSRGLIANDGAIPVSSRQDVIDTLTRTVKDAAYLVSTMAGRSERDEGTWDIPFQQIPDFTEFCNGTDLSGVTIGVPRNTFDSDPTSPIMWLTIPTFLQPRGSSSSTIRSGVSCDPPEFRRDIGRYLKTLKINPHNIQSAEDIIGFTKTSPEEEYPERDIGKFLWTQAEGIDRFYCGEGGILGAMEKHNLDVLVIPSTLGISNDLAAKMGFPVLGAQLGFHPKGTPIELDEDKPHLVQVAPGIPYSLTFISKAFSEGVLLRVAYAFEQLSAVRDNGPLPFKLPATELKDVEK